MRNFSSNLLAGILSTIIGGALLTFTFFLFDEYFYHKINLTGEWIVKTKTNSSGYKPFINMEQEFKLEILQKDKEIVGSGEKVKEISPDKSVIVFNPEKRVRLEILGYFERNYLSESKAFLNVVENGERAYSTTSFFLTYIDDNHLKGRFISTVSSCNGDVELVRTSIK